MALVSKAFGDIITFTRASTATYFDATGTLQSAAIDVPRFDYDPATLAARGFLIEEARTNNFTYSEDLTDASWAKNNATVTANSIASPDGSINADKLVEDTATSAHNVDKTFSVTSGTTYTYSIFLKAGERSAVRILFSAAAFGSNLTANYDISVGAWRTSSPTPSAALTLTSQDIGNGWYRISASAAATASVSAIFRIGLLDSPSSTGSYTGDGVSGAYFWGAQLEVGAFPTSYIPTTTTALTRTADLALVNPVSPWFNATEGTLFAEAEMPVIAPSLVGIRAAANLSDNTINNRLQIGRGGDVDNARLRVVSAGVSQNGTNGQPISGVFASSNIAKLAFAYATDNMSAAANGTVAAATPPNALPIDIDRLAIGSRFDTNADNMANGWVRRVTYYPRRLSNAELASITA